MAENTATSTPLSTTNPLSADAVDSPAGDIRYYITGQIPSTPTYFTLPDPTNGVIKTTTNGLDYETTDSVVLEVKACDSKGQPGCLSVTGLVYVTVTNVNEFAPAFAQVSCLYMRAKMSSLRHRALRSLTWSSSGLAKCESVDCHR